MELLEARSACLYLGLVALGAVPACLYLDVKALFAGKKELMFCKKIRNAYL